MYVRVGFDCRCPDNACDNVKCDSMLTAESCNNNGGLLKAKGGFCQCCDICVQQLGISSRLTVSFPYHNISTFFN